MDSETLQASLATDQQKLPDDRQSLEVQQQRLTTEQQANDAARQMLDAERRAFEAEKNQLTADATQSRRLSEQQAALAAAREAFERQRDAWEREREQLQARITDEIERCQQQLGQLNRLRQEFDRERTAWNEHRQAENAELAARRELYDRQFSELEAHTRSGIDPYQAAGNADAGALSPPAPAVGDWPVVPTDGYGISQPAVGTRPQWSSTASPEDRDRDEAAFARLRDFGLLNASNESGHRGASSEPDVLVADASQADASELLDQYTNDADAAAEAREFGKQVDEEESIDDYMVRLMTRLRGGPTDEPKPVPRAARAVPPVAAQGAEPQPLASAKTPEIEHPVPPAAPVSGQLVARSAPPELGVDLKAMRALANMTTRGAIIRHAQGRWSRAAVINAIGGSVGVIAGLWLVCYPWSSFGWFFRLAGLASVGGGGYFAVQGVKVIRHLRSANDRMSQLNEQEREAGDPAAVPAESDSKPNPTLIEVRFAKALSSLGKALRWPRRRS